MTFGTVLESSTSGQMVDRSPIIYPSVKDAKVFEQGGCQVSLGSPFNSDKGSLNVKLITDLQLEAGDQLKIELQ